MQLKRLPTWIAAAVVVAAATGATGAYALADSASHQQQRPAPTSQHRERTTDRPGSLSEPDRKARQKAARPRSQTIHVPSGAAFKRFDVSEPFGVIRLLRMTVPHGTRVRLTGAIPQLASVFITSPADQQSDPSESCQRDGAVDVCTQEEEACPMPSAAWHFRLHKLAGPAGKIRLEFLVG